MSILYVHLVICLHCIYSYNELQSNYVNRIFFQIYENLWTKILERGPHSANKALL